MTRISKFFLILWAAAVGGAAAAAPSAVVSTPQVRAELVAHAPEGVAAGKPLWLGLKIDHQPHWHTYWKNPGDSGLPTTLEWTLPAGWQVGSIQWPTPQRLPIGPLMNYGYEGTLLLPVAVTAVGAAADGSVQVRLRAEWLVCKDVCIPEGGDFSIELPVQAATAGHAGLFATARAAQPQSAAGTQASAAVEGNQLVLKVAGLPPAWQGQRLQFFPELPGVVQNAGEPTTSWSGNEWTARVALDAQRSESPALLPAVLVTAGQNAGLQIELKLTTAWPPAAPSAAAPLPALGDAQVTVADASPPVGALTLGGALLLALLGGALLNLMPCVFPVLSLKVLAFAQHADDRRGLWLGGLAYTAGVVMSFVALAALLLALRAGGEQLGWGFQLQSPPVVALLAVLFTLIGLNLVGVFEVGHLLPGRWAAARARHPAADAWLTGVLAVAVASPCTAPFMGASLGLAVALPTWQALLVFATLGLGMALPYLLVSGWPALARALPRPGVWMLHFKTVMAFPMFATVVWLVWVLGQQQGIDAVAGLLALLLALAFLAWALGSRSLGLRGRRGFGALALGVLVACLAWALPSLRDAPAAIAQAGAVEPDKDGWLPWSAQRVEQAQAQGRTVFVDFTAAWCVTCQLNKKTTLAQAEVKALLAAKNVLLLRADWTRRDPAITAELSRLKRTGVPVYALYTPGAAGPKLLNEILSVAEIRSALSAVADST